MNPQDGVSLDLALGVAQAVVLLRFLSLLRVTLAIPDLHSELLRLLREEAPGARSHLRKLSYTSPYAEAALTLLDRDSADPGRPKMLRRAEALSRKEALVSARRGQMLDLFGLLLLSAGLVSAPTPWSGDPLTLVLGLGTLVTLGATLLTRRALHQRLSRSLAELRALLGERPSGSPLERFCPHCGQPELFPVAILIVGEESRGPLAASHCQSCGAVMATGRSVDLAGPPSSSAQSSAAGSSPAEAPWPETSSPEAS